MSDKWFHLLNLWHPSMNCLKNDDIPWFETWCDHASLLTFVSCETCIFLPMVSFSRYLITLLMHFLIHWERELFFFFLFVKEILIQSSYTTCMQHSVEWRLKRLSSWWKWTTMLCCYFSSLESSSFIWSFLKEILTLFLMGTAKKRYASQPIFFSFSGQEKKKKRWCPSFTYCKVIDDTQLRGLRSLYSCLIIVNFFHDLSQFWRWLLFLLWYVNVFWRVPTDFFYLKKVGLIS